jgi:hypothetical protein
MGRLDSILPPLTRIPCAAAAANFPSALWFPPFPRAPWFALADSESPAAADAQARRAKPHASDGEIKHQHVVSSSSAAMLLGGLRGGCAPRRLLRVRR